MWKQLTVDDLRLILSEDEITRLNSISKSQEINSIIQDTLDLVADTWRGAIISKGYDYDIREHYIPLSYSYWILVHARYVVWTRFPKSPNIALDSARQSEYEKALDLLEKMYIGADIPDDEYSHKKQEEKQSNNYSLGSIEVPIQVIDRSAYIL